MDPITSLESALEIKRSELGDRHPETASSLNNLAALHYSIDLLRKYHEIVCSKDKLSS
jgi:hypothetical protein